MYGVKEVEFETVTVKKLTTEISVSDYVEESSAEQTVGVIRKVVRPFDPNVLETDWTNFISQNSFQNLIL